MLPIILIVVLTLRYSAANPGADPTDDIIRSEIESAARDSRALADELAAMLARLEAEDDREDAIEAAVIGDNEKVKEALTEMVDKIEDLAQASEDSNISELTKAVKSERIKEEELKNTLEELEIVATQIEEISLATESTGDIKAVDKMTELLQNVSDKVEKKTKNIDRNRKKANKKSTNTSLELNGIDEMIRSLEKVTHDLRDLNIQTQEKNKEIPLETNSKKIEEKTNKTNTNKIKEVTNKTNTKKIKAETKNEVNSKLRTKDSQGEKEIKQRRQPKQLKLEVNQKSNNNNDKDIKSKESNDKSGSKKATKAIEIRSKSEE